MVVLRLVSFLKPYYFTLLAWFVNLWQTQGHWIKPQAPQKPFQNIPYCIITKPNKQIRIAISFLLSIGYPPQKPNPKQSGTGGGEPPGFISAPYSENGFFGYFCYFFEYFKYSLRLMRQYAIMLLARFGIISFLCYTNLKLAFNTSYTRNYGHNSAIKNKSKNSSPCQRR